MVMETVQQPHCMVHGQEVDETLTNFTVSEAVARGSGSTQCTGSDDAHLLAANALCDVHSPPQLRRPVTANSVACNRPGSDDNHVSNNRDTKLLMPRPPRVHRRTACQVKLGSSFAASHDRNDRFAAPVTRSIRIARLCGQRVVPLPQCSAGAGHQNLQRIFGDSDPREEDLQKFCANNQFNVYECVEQPVNESPVLCISHDVSKSKYNDLCASASKVKNHEETKEDLKPSSTPDVIGIQDHPAEYERIYGRQEPAPSHSPAGCIVHNEKSSDMASAPAIKISLQADQPARRSWFNAAVTIALVMFIVSRVIYLQKYKKRPLGIDTAGTHSAYEISNVALFRLRKKYIRPIVEGMNSNEAKQKSAFEHIQGPAEEKLM
ncbi:uncharacterized protein LOC144095512 [Amblyomma americanum]